MSERLSELLSPIVASTLLLSPTRYRLDGDAEVDVEQRPPASREDDFFHPNRLLHHLHRDLYLRFHAGLGAPAASAMLPDEQTFLAELQAAHAGHERWDAGWIVADVAANGGVVAEKHGRLCRWMPGQYRYDGAPLVPRRKSSITVLLRKHSLLLQPGYLYAFGAWIGDDVESLTGLRIYFNVDARHAAPLLALISGELDRRRLPFRFKCPSHPRGYDRVDTAVLYFATRHGSLVLSILADCRQRLAALLRPATPRFALRLVDGLALAEEPADGNSFGAGRALAIAEGLQQAFAAGAQADDERLATVLAVFRQRGYALDHPHLLEMPEDPHGLRQLQPFAD